MTRVRRAWARWRRARRSRLRYVVLSVPGTIIVAAGLRRSERLVGLLAHGTGDWF